MALPFHGRTINRDPIEQLMDKIAAEIGSSNRSSPPAVASAVELAGGLSFAVVDQIRAAECPAASFQATLIAAAKRASVRPSRSRRAGASRRNEQEIATTTGLFPNLRPEPKIRVPPRAATTRRAAWPPCVPEHAGARNRR